MTAFVARSCRSLKAALLSLICASGPLLSSCQTAEPPTDFSVESAQESSPAVEAGLCRNGDWYFANRTGLQATPLRESISPYGFMPLDEAGSDPAPGFETALSPYLLDVEAAIHLQADRIGLAQEETGLLVSAWAADRKLAEQWIEPDRITCRDGKLTLEMPGDWRYAFGSPGHASFSLELTLDPNGELVLRSLYRSWTVVFFTIPVMGTSDREMRFSALAGPLDVATYQAGPATSRSDCDALAGRYMPVGHYLTIPDNRNHTELKTVAIQELLPFADTAERSDETVDAPSLTVLTSATEGLVLTIHTPGDFSRVSRVEAAKLRCSDGVLEFGLKGNFDPAATFWLAGIAYGRVQLRLWRDDFGGLMLEAREITDGTVLVLLPIHHRESTWFRFAGFDGAAS